MIIKITFPNFLHGSNLLFIRHELLMTSRGLDIDG